MPGLVLGWIVGLQKEYCILCATVLTPVLGQSLLEHGHRQGGALGANAPHLESQNPFRVFVGLHDVLTMGRLVCVISARGKVDTRTTFHFSACVSVRGTPIWKGIYSAEKCIWKVGLTMMSKVGMALQCPRFLCQPSTLCVGIALPLTTV
jgi:hypothetical protein